MATALDYHQMLPQSKGSTTSYSRPQTNGTSRSFGHAATQQLSEKENAHYTASSKRTAPSDIHYLTPYHKTGNRPTPGNTVSRSGSEADSLLDLYGQPRSQASTSVEKHGSPPPMEEPSLQEEDPEQSRWIHRDKLAIIESKELQEAGIQVPVPARINSKAKRRRHQSHDWDARREREASPAKEDIPDKIPFNSPPEGSQYGEEEDYDLTDFDLRTPEEIAADSYTSPAFYRQQSGLRSSSSRIPIARAGPIPLPQEPRERNTPLPRTRGASGTWTDEDGIAYPKIRSRTQSFGSQVLLDEIDPPNYSPSHSRQQSTNTTPISPSKPRTPNNRPSTSSNNHSRKPSSSNGVRNFTSPEQAKTPTSVSAKPTPTRSVSAPRSKSRSGLEHRPPTAVNRPEGEPPWIATMYKPDPRLPPDQQLLPTHAKRIQQEEAMRAAKEQDPEKKTLDSANGKGGTGQGPGPRPLAVHTKDGLQNNSTQPHQRSSPHAELDSPASQGGAWPLKPLTSPLVPNSRALNTSPTSNPSPVSPLSADGIGNERLNSISGASTGGHGGYSTMPKVQQHHGNGSMVALPSPSPGLAGGRERSPLPNRIERKEKIERPGLAEERRKEKECGCCVVM